MIMTREEEIIKASREYAMNKSNENNTWFVDYKDIEEAFVEGAEFADNHHVNVWHDATEKPRTKEWLLVQFEEDDYDTLYFIILSIDMWCDCCKNFHVIQWAYISDLLPKGGEK